MILTEEPLDEAALRRTIDRPAIRCALSKRSPMRRRACSPPGRSETGTAEPGIRQRTAGSAVGGLWGKMRSSILPSEGAYRALHFPGRHGILALVTSFSIQGGYLVNKRAFLCMILGITSAALRMRPEHGGGHRSGSLTVVATVFPAYDFARAVGGDPGGCPAAAAAGDGREPLLRAYPGGHPGGAGQRICSSTWGASPTPGWRPSWSPWSSGARRCGWWTVCRCWRRRRWRAWRATKRGTTMTTTRPPAWARWWAMMSSCGPPRKMPP